MRKRSIAAKIKKGIKALRPIEIHVNQVCVSPSELLKDKVAIVTGASRGIGKAVTKAFISSGATVIGVARDSDRLNRLQAELISGQFIPYACDISETDKIRAHLNAIQKMVGGRKITIFVNCAGVKNGNEERFFDYSPEEFDWVVNTNLKGTFFWCQAFAEELIKREARGHIVNVISIKGFIGEASPYSVSKWGCVSLTKGLARMLAPKGIVVNGVAPGGTATDMAQYQKGDSLVHMQTPLMRLAIPEEIANTVLFLASDLGENIVGDIIISDGGQCL